MIMKSDIYVVVILTQPKGLKKVLNILEWTLERWVVIWVKPVIHLCTKQYCNTQKVVFDSGDVLYC